ncbi:putative ABC transport system permease protein [Paenibacillus turicensis]|uniref:ABC transport system permease protein n=1 Tax=Paenibacillus turicensis TaxID=160487 RepID=A0ABS4FX59_9BACL|nr:ABC transporter permease [Paenibacillus turicensis]MBP1907157.1 putative ABC transport system permease protein [Paenibacillus turicensis]
MNNYTGLTVKYLKGQKKRTWLTILGIVLSVSLLTSIGTIGVSYRDKLIRQSIHEYGDYHVSFNNMSGEGINKLIYNATIEKTGIVSREGYGIISQTSQKEQQENPNAAPYRYLNIKNYDSTAMDMLQIQLESGRLPARPDEILLPKWSLSLFPQMPIVGKPMKIQMGTRIDASTGKAKKIDGIGDFGWSLDEKFRPEVQKEFTVVGIMKTGSNLNGSSTFILPAITFKANTSFDHNQKYFIYAKMKEMNHIKDKTEAIMSSLQITEAEQGSAVELNRNNYVDNVRVEYNNALLKLYGQSTYKGVNQSLIWATVAVILLIMICTIAVIYNTFHISVLERISQFGILRCIGATPAQIRNIVLKEATLLSLVGIPIGIFTGTLLMKLLFYNISLLSLGFFNDMKMVISIPVILVAGSLGLVSVYLSALGPARQASRVSPLDAIKSAGATKVEHITKFKKSNSKLGLKTLGIEGQFARRNLKRNQKRFRITIFSMAISILLFIVLSDVVNILKESLQVSGSKYSYSLIYNRTSGHIDEGIYNKITSLDSVEKAYKFYNSQVAAIIPQDKINPNYRKLNKEGFNVPEQNGYRTSNNFIQSYGYNGLDDFKDKLTSGTINKEKMDAENGVIIIQKINVITDEGKQIIINQTNFKVGDKIQIRSMGSIYEGRSNHNNVYHTVTVVGIADHDLLSDQYTNSVIRTFITTPKVYNKVIGADSYKRIFILADPEKASEPITTYLQSVVDKDAGYSYNDRATELAEAKNDTITTAIFLYGFMGVIILIAFLNILNTMSTNLILRTKEFAVLKSIGMTQTQMTKMIFLEGIFYGVIAAIYGSIVGTAISYGVHYLLANAIDMGWSIPWFSIFISFVGAILTTILASLWPLRRLRNTSIVESLRGEN